MGEPIDDRPIEATVGQSDSPQGWIPAGLREQIIISLPRTTHRDFESFLQRPQDDYDNLTLTSVDQGRGQLIEAFQGFYEKEAILSARPDKTVKWLIHPLRVPRYSPAKALPILVSTKRTFIGRSS